MTPDFWGSLKGSFRSMRTRYGDRLAATCCSAPLHQGFVTWFFLGSTGDRELDRFKVLAGRAASGLGCATGDSAIAFWLDSLMAESAYRTRGPLVTYCDAHGGRVTVEYEMIDELYKASADHCRQLANRYSSIGFFDLASRQTKRIQFGAPILSIASEAASLKEGGEDAVVLERESPSIRPPVRHTGRTRDSLY